MGCFGWGMPPRKHPKHSFCGIAYAPQGICNCPGWGVFQFKRSVYTRHLTPIIYPTGGFS